MIKKTTEQIKKDLKSRIIYDVNGSKAFAIRLKELREAAGMTQAEFADELGVSRGSIGYYEKNERVPDINFLFNVAQKFNLPFDYLMGESASFLHERTAISEILCLSDRAIENIIELDDFEQILSRIFEHCEFNQLFCRINYFVTESSQDEPDKLFDEFCAFSVSRHFLNILMDIKEEFRKNAPLSKQNEMSEEEISRVRQLYENSLEKKYRDYIEKKAGDTNGNDPQT